MTEADKSSGGTASEDAPDKRSPRTSRRERARSGVVAARTRVAALVWLAAVVSALFLAVGALLIALQANEDNDVVRFVLDAAATLAGPFGLTDGIFTFPADDDGRVRSALTNWGIAAVVYLVIGKILDRVIRP